MDIGKPTDYLDFIRSHTCMVCPQVAIPHHVITVGMGRDRRRQLPEHYSAVPVCPSHHHELEHDKAKFEETYRVDVFEMVVKYFQQFIGDMIDAR